VATASPRSGSAATPPSGSSAPAPTSAWTATSAGWNGGGKELYAEIQAAAKLELVSFLFGPVPCEPLGWFKKPIKGIADLKGLKFRTAGLAVDMFNQLGMSTVQLAPADIVPAIDRGVLDGAEFASASDDRIMGFPDVAFYLQQSYHMSNNFAK
jgi:TRAP-type mannitol/chloroaromatic compound transport system substrate-binding protein